MLDPARHVSIGWAAVARLIHPRALQDVAFGVGLSGAASVVNLAVGHLGYPLSPIARSDSSPTG